MKCLLSILAIGLMLPSVAFGEADPTEVITNLCGEEFLQKLVQICNADDTIARRKINPTLTFDEYDYFLKMDREKVQTRLDGVGIEQFESDDGQEAFNNDYNWNEQLSDGFTKLVSETQRDDLMLNAILNGFIHRKPRQTEILDQCCTASCTVEEVLPMCS